MSPEEAEHVSPWEVTPTVGKISELVCQELLCACFHRQGPTVYNICTEF